MHRLLIPLLLAGGPLLAACEPSCERVCKKIVACEAIDTPRQAVLDCQDSCELQQQLYEDWEDLQAREALADLKECVMDEECDAIADGVCYDADLFVW